MISEVSIDLLWIALVGAVLAVWGTVNRELEPVAPAGLGMFLTSVVSVLLMEWAGMPSLQQSIRGLAAFVGILLVSMVVAFSFYTPFQRASRWIHRHIHRANSSNHTRSQS